MNPAPTGRVDDLRAAALTWLQSPAGAQASKATTLYLRAAMRSLDHAQRALEEARASGARSRGTWRARREVAAACSHMRKHLHRALTGYRYPPELEDFVVKADREIRDVLDAFVVPATPASCAIPQPAMFAPNQAEVLTCDDAPPAGASPAPASRAEPTTSAQRRVGLAPTP